MYNFPETEQKILKFWEEKKIFQKLRAKNAGKKRWSYLDGPITANNPMGVHHAWGRTYKDLRQRYKAMQGFDERYQNGFDCQGLWVEVEVEKDLGFNSKKDIENYGLDKFSKACRKRVEKYSKIQTEQSIRLGQWMDWENSYYTLSDNNIEHIWYFLKKCHEKKWLLKNTRVMPWCYRCGTSLSQHELVDSYKDMTHTSVYLKLPIKGKENEFLLIWTTTPWTLTSNVAAAVNPSLNYVKVEQNEEFYYLSEKTAQKLKGDYKILEKIKFLYTTENYKHRYPTCWRCSEELVFRLVAEWFISSDEIRAHMKREAKKVKWQPEHGGRLMQDWLNNMGDWCISRKRFWGLPLMFYECLCGNLEVVGSIEELRKKATDPKLVDELPELHRPWIDRITIKCSKCKQDVERILDVGDCWLDAGIIPFSTLNYMNDKTYWKKWFPAEFITEMREQIRLWFYAMLFMSVTLEDKTPYESVLVYEKVHDEKGMPMHKSWGNAIWFDDAVEKMGADVMRWLYSSQNPNFNLNFGYTPAKEVKRNLDVIWNLGNYVKLYCKTKSKEESDDVASKWIISRRETTKEKVAEYLEKLQPNQAIKEIKQFLIDDLSRTYGQLIRNNLDDKKVQAVLYNSYLEGLKLLAPFLPFITEKLYKDLCKNEKSIFLESYPIQNKKLINKQLESGMQEVSEIVQEILSQRDKEQIGMKWPLAKVEISSENTSKLKKFTEIIKIQTNVKAVKFKEGKTKVVLDTKTTPELEKEGFTREVIRRVQSLRKQAGLNKEDKIVLAITSSIELEEKTIKKTVGASEIKPINSSKFIDKFKVKDKEFEIKIKVIN